MGGDPCWRDTEEDAGDKAERAGEGENGQGG